MNTTQKDRLFREAFALLDRAQALILSARAKHEQKLSESRKAA